MQNGIPVGLRSSPSFGLSRSGQLTAIIQSLFWDGSQGWWYDDNDTTTLFQDSAGTTPVTAVEQFVGLQLDKSKGLVLGPELVTNGDFSSGTTGWANNSIGTSTLTVVNGQLVASYTDGSNFARAYQVITCVAGSFHRLSFQNAGSSSVRLRIGASVADGTNLDITVAPGATETRYFSPPSASRVLTFQSTGGSAAVIDNVSVRELPGNHRYAPASGNRPIWSKRVNLLTKTEQFDDAVWTKGNATITANATTAPDGSITADKVIANLGAIDGNVFQPPALAASTSYTESVYCKKAEWNWVALQTRSNTTDNIYAWFNLDTGTVGTVQAGGSATITNAGNGWYLCSLTRTTSATPTSTRARIFPTNADNVISTGDGTSGIFIWGADVRPANQATGTMPLYQRVNTSTDYETNGFPGYLKADGVDDFLQTNSIDFSAGPTNPPLGPELVVNGDFSSSAGWNTAGSSWTVASGVASNTGVSGNNINRSDASFVAGRTYLVTFDIVSITAGGLVAELPGVSIGPQKTTAGTYRAYIVARASGTTFFIYASGGNFAGSIDNVSIKEITNANLGADKITLCAGVRKLSDAAQAVVTELSASIASNNGTFLLAAPDGATNTYGWDSKGTTQVDAVASTFTAPITNVVTGIGNISGDSAIIRVNGVVADTETGDQGTGNYGNYPAYFFHRNTSPATLRFNGYEYGNIAVGKLLTADQLTALETYMNGLTKAY